MKILIYKRNSLINSSGGAEKVMCSMANHFAETGNNVLFLTRDMRPGMPFYPLNERVKLERHDRKYNKLLHLCGKILKAAGIIGAFPFCDRDLFIAKNNRKIIDGFKPDVIIATSPADAVELLYKQTGLPPVIVTLHSFPLYFFKNKKKAALYKRILKQVSAVQVLQPSFVQELKPYYDGKIEVIGNIVVPAGGEMKAERLQRIIYLSRVEPDKQQSALTEAFCKIAPDFPDWTVDFFGDITHPEYMRKCLQTAEQYGVEDQIRFHGITKDVQSELQKASLCVFPSKYEGFSLGLTEALAAGLPAIGFSHAPGVNDLITDGESGFLVSDIDEMAQKMALLMNADILRERMGQNAAKSMLPYAPETIWSKWDSLVEKTVNAASLKDTPVYIISFNRLSYLEQCVNWLEKADCTNIHIVDNASTYPPLLDYLAQTKHTVHRMEKNYGHTVLFDAPEFKDVVDNQYFVLTDPNVLPVENCPADFMRFLYGVLKRFPKITKAGFSLKLDDLPDHYALKQTVIKWERAFYENAVKGTSPVLYKAPIDTTFALYRPRKEWKKSFGNAIRTGFPYQARHLPWYKDLNDLTEEDRFYNALDAGSGNWNGTKDAAYFKTTERRYIKLFGFLPVMKIKCKKNKKTFLLFCCLPVLRIKEGK